MSRSLEDLDREDQELHAAAVRDARSQRFGLVYEREVRRSADLRPNAWRVWCLLCCYADRESRAAWPGQQRLADDLGMSTRTVERCIAELAHRRWLTVDRVRPGNGQPGWPHNVYTLHGPPR